FASLASPVATPLALPLRSGAVTRPNSARDGGSFTSSGSTRAPDQAITTPARVSLAMLVIAFMPSYPPSGVDRCDPSSEVAVTRPLEAGSLDHSYEGFLIGEAPYALHQIPVRGGVAGDQRPKRRDRIHGIGVVERIEERRLH